MAFTKITNQELNSRGATTLPNQPAISATALKAEFDAPAKEIVAPKVNNLIDELEAGTAAASIGAVAPSGMTGNTVQAILDGLAQGGGGGGITVDDAMSSSSTNPVQNKVINAAITSLSGRVTTAEGAIESLDAAKHTHSNKSLLDTYTQTESDLADAVAKKHTHSNKSTLDKLSEDGSGNPTYNGNTIPTSGQTGGLQSFIDQDLLVPTGSGQVGDLKFVGANGGTSKDLYRYDESAGWTKCEIGSGGGGGGGIDYKTDEQDTGLKSYLGYASGAPVYQRSFHVAANFTNNSQEIEFEPAISTLIDFDIFLEKNYGASYQLLPFYFNDNNYLSVGISKTTASSPSKTFIGINKGNQTSIPAGSNFVITMRYTKPAS